MPVLIALLGIAVAAYFWMQRAKNARDMVGGVTDMANDVRAAARRFGFRRQSNVHPVESIEDPRLAIASIATAFLELDDLPTAEQRERLTIQIRAKLRADAAEAEEMEPLMNVLKGTVTDSLSDRQRDALEDIKRALRVR